jgi:hypothetical protein
MVNHKLIIMATNDYQVLNMKRVKEKSKIQMSKTKI